MLLEKITQTKNYICKKLELNTNNMPKFGLVLGSGLSGVTKIITKQKNYQKINYADIPNFCSSTVSGHSGELIKFNNLFILSGRLHNYEGYSPQEIVFPVRVLAQLGVDNFILTNASGGIFNQATPGDLMIISDHINLTGYSPLTGPNYDSLGPRFVDMMQAYDKNLRNITQQIAQKLNLKLHEGVYAGVSGPNYETPAEVTMLKSLGADAVGMSTVFETIALRHMGKRVLALSCITNKASGLGTGEICHQEVLQSNQEAAQKLGRIIQEII